MLKPGINNCTNAEYHADRVYLSSSVLKTVLKSLDDYKKQYIDGEAKVFGNRNALDVGSLVHSLILEPDTVSSSYNFFPGFRKAGKEFESFIASLPKHKADLPIISTPQKVQADTLVAAYRRNSTAVEIMKNVVCEQTIAGELNGVPIKVRFDAIDLENGRILDVKTTGYAADTDSFKQTIKDLSYSLSGALYCAMAEQFYGKPFTFYYIVLSKIQPEECRVFKTSEATAATGLRMVQTACQKYLKAKETNIWTEPTKAVKLDATTAIEEV
jgi:hypothetical protein